MIATIPLDVVTKRLAGAGLRVAWSAADVRAILRRYGASAADGSAPIMRAVTTAAPVMAAAPAAANDPNRRYTFTVSTSNVDRMGDTIAVSGWKLDAYRQNPVVLWSHDGSNLPVGRSTKIWTEGNRLKATVELASKLTPYAETLRQAIAGGFVRGASVGFRPLKFKFSEDKARPGGIDFLEQELLEWSIVTVPANGEALLDPGQTGKAMWPAAARRQRDLDEIRLRARW